MKTLVEINPKIITEALQLLQTNSQLVGPDYYLSYQKKVLDRVVGGILGAGAILPIAVLAGIVWFSDKHKPFMATRRTFPYANQTYFPIKIRSMVPDAFMYEDDMLKTRYNQFNQPKKGYFHDPRITKVGTWLRKNSLDELPQLVEAGIGYGGYSLVGPRGYTKWEIETFIKPNVSIYPYSEVIIHYQNGLKYGVTGFYQILGRGLLTIPDRVMLDEIYGDHASLAGDLRIIMKTFSVVLSRKGAQ